MRHPPYGQRLNLKRIAKIQPACMGDDSCLAYSCVVFKAVRTGLRMVLEGVENQ